MLAKLKDVGPFTSDMEVDHYTEKERNATKRQRRMKMEVQFCFQNLTRIEITLPSKTRRHKTSVEYSVTLKTPQGNILIQSPWLHSNNSENFAKVIFVKYVLNYSLTNRTYIYTFIILIGFIKIKYPL